MSKKSSKRRAPQTSVRKLFDLMQGPQAGDKNYIVHVLCGGCGKRHVRLVQDKRLFVYDEEPIDIFIEGIDPILKQEKGL